LESPPIPLAVLPLGSSAYPAHFASGRLASDTGDGPKPLGRGERAERLTRSARATGRVLRAPTRTAPCVPAERRARRATSAQSDEPAEKRAAGLVRTRRRT
jgi:hypothetical protein